MKKRIASIILSLVMLLSLLPTTAFADTVTTLDGKGTETDPYLIGTLAELEFMASKVNTSSGKIVSGSSNPFANAAYYRLTADIGDSTHGFTTPIGTSSSIYFNGYFDGADHTVWLDIAGALKYTGLFGWTGSKAVISHVAVAGTASTSSDYACGIASRNGGTIKNCVNRAEITGRAAGGIACLNNGTIDSCINLGELHCTCGAGGIAASNSTGSTIVNCVNKGDIYRGEYDYATFGGIAGDTSGPSTIKNSINFGNIYNEAKNENNNKNVDVGGIACFANSNCSIVNCANSGIVPLVLEDRSGGVTGRVVAGGSASNAYYETDVGGVTKAIGTESGTVTDVSGLTGAQMKAESGVDNALIDKLNGYKDGGSYPSGWLTWYKATGEYPTLPCHVNVVTTGKGTVTITNKNRSAYNVEDYFAKGDEVTLTVAAGKNYEFTSLQVNCGSGETVSVTDNRDGTYSFTMPASPVTVETKFTALPHIHKIDGADVTFQPWTDATKLPAEAGSWYLDTDVTLSSTWTVPAGGVVNLCLNGHVIKLSSSYHITVSTDGTTSSVLNLFDCDDGTPHYFLPASTGAWTWQNTSSGSTKTITGGVITGTTNSCGVEVNRGIFNMYGGTICGNKRGSGGGGVYVSGNSTLIGKLNMRGGTICGNMATAGGGVYVDQDSEFTMYDGTICNNYASSSASGDGGGGVNTVGTFTMEGGTIRDNTAVSGGGLYIYTYNKPVVMNGGTICNNTAKGSYTMGGGGVLVGNGATPGFTMHGGAICNNTSANAYGGGVHVLGNDSNIQFIMDGGTVSGNSSYTYGGGVYAPYRGSATVGGTAVISGNKKTNNNSNDDLYIGTSGSASKNNVGDGTNGAKVPADGMCIGLASGCNKLRADNAEYSKYVKYFFADEASKYVAHEQSSSVYYITLKAPSGTQKKISVTQTEHGITYVDKQVAAADETVTVSAAPDTGYILESVSVSSVNSVTDKEDGTFTFTMPSSAVTVTPTFDKSGPSIKVTKAKDAQGKELENPVYGTAASDLQLFTVTKKRFNSTPSLTLQWQHIDKNTGKETWNATSPAEGLSATAEGKVTTTNKTPAGSYVFRIITGTEGESGFVSSGPITLTVDKATPTVSEWPTATAFAYGTYATIGDVPLSGGTASVGGSFAWKTDIASTSATVANSKAYAVVFTPTDTDNYNTVSDDVTVTVNKAALTATASSHTVAYGSTAPTYTVSYTDWVNGAETPTTAAVLTSTYTAASDVGSYDVSFSTAPVFANYEVTTAKGTVTVERLAISVPTAEVGLVYNGQPQTGVKEGTGYTLANNTKTDAGNYEASATPDKNHKWEDGSTEAKTISWSIDRADYDDTYSRKATGELKAKKNSTVDIELPDIPSGASYGTPAVAEGLTSYVSAVVQDTNKLHLTVTTAIPANTEPFKVTVPVTPDANHNSYNIIVTVTPVYKTVVTITAEPDGFTYGDANKTGYKDASAKVNSEEVSGLADTLVATYYKETATAGTYETTGSTNVPTDAGNYQVVLSVPGTDENYEGKSEPIAFTIAKKTVTLIWSTIGAGDDAYKATYDGNNQMSKITASYEDVAGASHNLIVSVNKTFQNAGEYTAEVTGFDTTNDTGSKNYALPTTKTQTYTMKPKPVTVTAVPVPEKTYDGTKKTPLRADESVSGATFSGLCVGDSLSLTDVTGEYVSPNVSDAQTVNLNASSNWTLSDTNYVLAAEGQPTTTTGKITKAALTVTAKPKTISFTDAAANNGVTYTGFVNGETESVLGGTLTYAYKVTNTDTDYTTSSPVGTYDIIPGGLTSDNYEITFVKGTLTVGAKAIDKPTEDTTAFTYTSSPQTYSPVGFDSNTMEISGNTQTNANESGYTVTVTPKTGYVWSDGGTCTFTWVIAKKEVGLTWSTLTADELVYSKTAKTLSATATGVVEGDTCTVTVALNTAANSNVNVGSFSFKATELSNSNYKLPATVTSPEYTITAKEVGLEWSTLTADKLVYSKTAKTLSATATGVESGDTCDVTVALNTDEGSNVNVGSFSFKATELSNSNYKLPDNKVSDAYTITPKEAALSWTAPASLVYSSSAKVPTVSVSNLESGDSCTVTAALTEGNDNINVGTFTYTASALGNPNYKLPDGSDKKVSETYTITAFDLTNATVTVNPTAYDYTGSEIKPTPAVTFDGTNAIPTEDYEVSYTDNTNAGTATVTVTANSANVTNSKSANFTINKVAKPGTTPTSHLINAVVYKTLSLSDIGITLQGAKITKVEAVSGKTGMVLNGTPTIAENKLSISWTTKESPSGTVNDQYDLTVSSDNWNDFTVTVSFKGKIPVTFSGLTAANAVYDGQPKTGVTGTAVCTANSTDVTSACGTLVYTYYKNSVADANKLEGAPVDAGNYKLVVSVPDDCNQYIGSSGEYSFTIETKTITIVWAEDDFTYNKTAQTDSITASYKDVGGTPHDLTVAVKQNSNVIAFQNAGDYTAEVIGFAEVDLGSKNYALPTTKTQTYTMKQKPVTVLDVTVADKTYNGETEDAAFTGAAVFEGLCEGDTMTLSGVKGTYASANAGSQKVNLSGTWALSNNNYKLADSGHVTYAFGTITKAAQTTAAAAPTVSGNTVTVAAADRTKKLEYCVDDNKADDEKAWISVPTLDANGTFTVSGLAAGNHTVYLRVKESSNYNASASVSKTFTLTQYSVAYNANGGVGSIASQTANSGSSVTVKSGSGFSRTGYTFDGWKDENGTSHAVGSTVSNGMTLYAQWEANTYTVRFNANGGSGTMANESFTYDAAKALTAKAFTRTSYTFVGWATSANGPVLYADKQSVKNLAGSGTVTLYAIWAQNVYSINVNITSPQLGAIKVKLKQGNAVYAVADNASIGGNNNLFTGVPAGTYNVEVTQTIEGGKNVTMTQLVVLAADETVNITLPASGVNSVLEVKEDTRPAVVGGLDKEAESNRQSGKDITVTMTVEKQEEQQLAATADEKEKETQAAISEIKAEANGKALDFMNIEIEKTTTDLGTSTSTTETITETAKVLELVFSYEMNGKKNIQIYRQHGDAVQTFTKLDTKPTTGYEDGKFYVDTANSLIYVYAKQFSTYAIGYEQEYSGGGSSYAVELPANIKNGKVEVSPKNASAGQTVTLTVTPDKGFTLETLTVLDKNGKEVEVKSLGNNKYSFKMPSGKVSISATFMEDNSMLNFFVDVKATDYYYDAVLWAAENDITKGTDAVHFSPNAPVTRAQVVTFLWRAAGKPVVNYAMSFADVSGDAYYTEAVRWAVAEGITKGTSDTTFSPDKVCTRGQIVTFLARFAGVEDDASGYSHGFTDVKATDYYNNAVAWAKDNKVTEGTSATTFSPNTDCTRAQVVTFLYRYMSK